MFSYFGLLVAVAIFFSWSGYEQGKRDWKGRKVEPWD